MLGAGAGARGEAIHGAAPLPPRTGLDSHPHLRPPELSSSVGAAGVCIPLCPWTRGLWPQPQPVFEVLPPTPQHPWGPTAAAVLQFPTVALQNPERGTGTSVPRTWVPGTEQKDPRWGQPVEAGRQPPTCSAAVPAHVGAPTAAVQPCAVEAQPRGCGAKACPSRRAAQGWAVQPEHPWPARRYVLPCGDAAGSVCLGSVGFFPAWELAGAGQKPVSL